MFLNFLAYDDEVKKVSSTHEPVLTVKEQSAKEQPNVVVNKQSKDTNDASTLRVSYCNIFNIIETSQGCA